MRRRSLACLVLGLALGLIHASGAWAADKTLDLRVLVISTGPASVDPGLDLMDDLLDQMGVPYDVLDSSTDVLTPGRLSSGDRGFYNGIILTNTELFLPDGSGSGFNFLEWMTLHDFEREFGVREAVISGFPASNPGLGLDYGMTDIIAGTSFSGQWVGPAGGTEVFEYVNEAAPLPITDFAFGGRPFVVYAGEPRATGVGPHVQPYLVWANDTDKVFVSRLLYDDGREVLLSTISNAWFLVHSQVLAYEFLNFATKGVFIGAREVYLETHVDDLFLETELWNPATNSVDLDRVHRLSAGELTRAVTAQTALREAYPLASDYTIDFPFNGVGAAPSFNRIPDATLTADADTWLRESDPNRSFGRESEGYVRVKTGDTKNALFHFDLSALPAREAETATLTLWTEGSDQIYAKVCPLTAAWEESKYSYWTYTGATWNNRLSSTAWTTKGGDYDATACIATRLLDRKYVNVDVTPIVSSWLTGARQNHGFVVVGTSSGLNKVIMREGSSSKRPALAVGFAPMLLGEAGAEDVAPQEALLPSVADTHIRQESPSSNYGKDYRGVVRLRSGDERRTLLRFDLSALSPRPVEAATLSLWTKGGDKINAKVCPATASWSEGTNSSSKDATWKNRVTGTLWATAGGDFDDTACVAFKLVDDAFAQVDVTDMVNAWLRGTPNNGIVIVPTSSGSGEVSLREDYSSKRPSLRIGLAPLQPVADTYIRQEYPTSNYGTSSEAYVRVKSGDRKRALIRFDLSKLRARPAENASLTLWTDGSDQINASVCRATSAWVETKATWQRRDTNVNWTTTGGDWDPASCVPFRLLNDKFVTVDVTPIVNSWLSGEAPNHGFLIDGTSSGIGWISTREGSSSKRPSLVVQFPPGSFDELTTAVVQHKSQFRFLNHTYTHRNLDAGAGATAADTHDEIDLNRATWSRLGLPDKDANDAVLVTGEHSGLNDRRGNDDPSDDILYPAGVNTQAMQAAQDLGVRYLASDASYPAQAFEQYVPGFNLLLLPRYPTAIFYNASTPAENTDEYNYIFYERFVNAGQDPCTIPGAICAPRTYEQILAAEADTTLRHMLTGKPWPHFFHQSNLRDYDGAGSTMLFDWLDAVLNRYDDVLTLPVRSLPYSEIATISEQRLAARSANVRGTINLTTGEVTLVANSQATVPVTGIAGGEVYGGQYIRRIDVDAVPQSLTADRLLGQ